MQPPPRTGPPGASGPPPSGGPNMFRRTRPHKHTAAAAAAALPPTTQPMTDPFAFVRAPTPMAAGGLPTVPNSNPPPMQTPPNNIYSQGGSGLPPQPQPLQDTASATPPGPPPSFLPGVTLFNPHSAVSPGILPAPGPAGYASSHTEQIYFNSREHTPSMAAEPTHEATPPAGSQTTFNQEFQGQPPPLSVPFQPVPPVNTSSHWAPDHGSRPPSVQNYFQPTSDPPPQLFNVPPQSQMYPTHTPSPHHNTSTPPIQPGHPHAPLPHQNPGMASSSQWTEPNPPPAFNSHPPQTQSYFSQSSAPQDSWFNQPSQDSGYHQMGTHPRPDPATHLAFNPGSGPGPEPGPGPGFRPGPGPRPEPGPGSGPGPESGPGLRPGPGPGPTSASAPSSAPYSQESGTLSMFFKDNDVENEETLAGEAKKAVNGILGSFQHNSNPQAAPQVHSGHGDVPFDFQGAPLQDHLYLPYMNDDNHPSQGNSQKPPDSQYDHVENLECVPNQEVLPSETHGSPAAVTAHGVDLFETGPNLETPDSVPRPMRSASVSSNYSNMSHGSGTGTRRHQGVVGTFIQQESPRLADDAHLPAAAGGYFEQIDTSPAGDMGAQQNSPEQIWAPTPSPPKPTGIFQASANSSFEPVRSHGVGVRPAEVDRAKMVVEGGADSTPGNLEQPPDNMENIYGPGNPLPAVAGGGVPHLAHPIVHSHSRPSSRAYGANRPCESPATTLWAQNDPTSLGTNILLAPAAPTVLAPLREPSSDVIQPPEDGPLDLHPPQRVQPTSQQNSENLENPPKVTKDAQQGVKADGGATVRTPVSSSTPQVPPAATQPAPLNTQQPPPELTKPSDSQAVPQGQNDPPSVPVSGAQTSQGQYSNPAQGPAAEGAAPPPGAAYPPGPRGPVPSGAPQAPPAEQPRPPSSSGSQQGYGPPPGPGQMYGGYYGSSYGDYPDGRAPHPPGQYPPPPGDPRAQQYYHPDGPYRSRADPWYGRYEGPSPAYHDPNYQYREPQPDRPSSRASQYSDRPSSRQGYPDDYHRANQSAYSDYYADYAKHYDYGGYDYGQYDPRYRGCYNQSYWSNYDDSYRSREGYYNQHMYPARKDGYDNQWRWYPGYDASFDEDHHWRGDGYGDDSDRRSVHSEQSAHSVHSSRSHHSRRSSFSSRSQQSQVYRSQPDIVSAVYDNTASTLAADYYGQYPNQTDASQNFSQYPYPSEYTADSTWIAPEEPPPHPATPEKFSMPHCCARFGPGGHFVQVLPNLPSAGQPALVDIHSLETMLQDTSAQSELRSFPGPLVKEDTHKVDVIKFSQNKALECSRDNNLLDRDSARLLWDFIVLLCRQNGTVVGTDIADLLLKEHRSVWLPGKSPNEANLIDFNNEPLSWAEEEPGAGPLSLLSDTFMTVPENVGKETERFRELLLFGRKKDALEAAMKAGLWGHALLLASKMDNRTHARVMTRFANSLPINDPLQTVYQLMSGRMPASATCCGEEKWGDWRPHLAMVLSNLTHTPDLDTRTITTMGDTLASKGLIDAAHFCYMMAQVGLGVYTKTAKMVLIGSNHSLPFYQFATNEAIQRTEAYEYAQSLGSQSCPLPNFQAYKFIYACRLAEAGLSAQAFHYCEVISKAVLMQPSYYCPIFISQLIQMSEKLRFFDPQLKEKPEQELFNEPEWLIHLRQLDGQFRTGVITYNADRPIPTQFNCSSPSSELDESSPPEPYSMPLEVDGPTPDNPLMSSLLPGPPPQGVQLMPPAPTSILQDGMPPTQPLPPSDVPTLYPVPPTGPPGHIPVSGYPPQDPGFGPPPPFQPQPEQLDMYPGNLHQPCPPPPQVGQVSPHMPPQMPHSPVQMNPIPSQMPPHMPPSPGHMPHAEQPPQVPLEMQTAQSISTSPPRASLTPQRDFYDHMALMGPGRRSRTTSQSSAYMPSGHRSRTTSESSTHSGGRERSNSAIKQASPPPPSIPEQPRKEEAKKVKKDSPKKGSGGGWLSGWFTRKGKNEAHLPDDNNKSIVWDEKKQRWIDMNEPEEESKPPPPPPSGFPSMPSMPGPTGPAAPPGCGPPVNMFSRKAGTKSRYVDVLNPRGTSKAGGLAPADIFAPLAPMTMPANLFLPSSVPDDQKPLEGSEGGNPEQAVPQMFNPTLLPPAPEGPPVPDGSQSGEGHPAPGPALGPAPGPAPAPAPTGGITFYNPAQFPQTNAPSGGGLRSGRLGGQRQYPVMK